MRHLFSFPNPVNEKAARTVAFVVMVVSAVGLATSTYWLFVPLAYGFVARVLTGPRLSPLGRLASAVVAPRLTVMSGAAAVWPTNTERTYWNSANIRGLASLSTINTIRDLYGSRTPWKRS